MCRGSGIVPLARKNSLAGNVALLPAADGSRSAQTLRSAHDCFVYKGTASPVELAGVHAV